MTADRWSKLFFLYLPCWKERALDIIGAQCMLVGVCYQVALPYPYLVTQCLMENRSQIIATELLGPECLKV